jgi:hypothetical protein
MTNRLKELERAYFVRKSGGAVPTKPFNQIKRDYIAGFVGGIGRATKVDMLETLWLRKIADTAGYTPAENLGDLWKQALLSIGATPTNNYNDNKIKFYSTAP